MPRSGVAIGGLATSERPTLCAVNLLAVAAEDQAMAQAVADYLQAWTEAGEIVFETGRS